MPTNPLDANHFVNFCSKSPLASMSSMSSMNTFIRLINFKDIDLNFEPSA